MKNTAQLIFRCISPLVLLSGLAIAARADPIAVAGSTTGAFNSSASSLGGLRFTGTSFRTTGMIPTESQTLTFGRFTLTNTQFNYNQGNQTFALNVLFTNPAASAAPQVASISGRVNKGVGIPNGNRPTINFGGPVTVSFAGGTFQLSLNDVVFNNFGTANLTGTVSGAVLAAASPEPHSVLLLGTILGGFGLVCRKRLASR